MATHSSVLAWRIPRTGEPGGLPCMGSHKVRHDRSDLAAVAAATKYLDFYVIHSFPYRFIFTSRARAIYVYLFSNM